MRQSLRITVLELLTYSDYFIFSMLVIDGKANSKLSRRVTSRGR